MTEIKIQLDREEYNAAVIKKGSKTWREVLLTGLNVAHDARRIGRPHASDALDEIYVELEARKEPREEVKF